MRVRGPMLAVAGAALAFVPGAATAPAPDLFGTVGPGFTIVVENSAGADVSRLDPGTYVIQVRDLSPDHNFHFFGPGVSEATGVETEGTVTWTVTVREGRYTIVCDPHPSQMIRTLTVGNPPPEPVPPAPKPQPAIPKLLATVGPKAAISLRSAKGARLHHLAPGRYAITVRDRSTVHNFHLVGKGVNRKTVVARTGTTTWTLRLAPGLLRWWSDKAPKTLKGSVRVG